MKNQIFYVIHECNSPECNYVIVEERSDNPIKTGEEVLQHEPSFMERAIKKLDWNHRLRMFPVKGHKIETIIESKKPDKSLYDQSFSTIKEEANHLPPWRCNLRNEILESMEYWGCGYEEYSRS